MPFTYDEMIRLRVLRSVHWRMAAMCEAMAGHSREEVVEAIDALVRQPNTRKAHEHVNRVLEMQAQGVPLINGWEAWEIEGPKFGWRA